jgi:hypothetical protein
MDSKSQKKNDSVPLCEEFEKWFVVLHKKMHPNMTFTTTGSFNWDEGEE